MSHLANRLQLFLILTTNLVLHQFCQAETSTTLYYVGNHLHNHAPSKSAVLSSTQPLSLASEQEWFTDIRVKLDLSEDSNQHEVNLGLASRKENERIGSGKFGYYAFWDISHIKNQVFAQQATLGLEWLTQQSHLAANLYVPQASFTTHVDLANQIEIPAVLAKTQQEGILQTVDTMPGFDLNLNHDVEVNSNNTVGINLTYAYFSKNQHTEQGPKVGLRYNNKSGNSSSNYTVFGSYDNYHKGSVGLTSSVQWQNKPARQQTRSRAANRMRIRDIDIRTTPVEKRPFIKVKERYGPLEWNTILQDYLNNNYRIITVQENEESDILVIGPLWLWEANLNHDKGAKQQQIDSIKKDKSKIKIFWTGEAANSAPDKDALDAIDLMIGFDYSDHPKYYRMPIMYYWTIAKNLHYPFDANTDLSGENVPLLRKDGCNPDAKKYFACFMQRNENTKDFNNTQDRIELFEKLSEYKFVASGGSVRNNVPRPEFTAEATMAWQGQCKFMIAYENQHYPGYITEKPFRPWLAGAIPLYDAHPSVKKDFNSKALLFRGDYDSVESYIDEIKRLDQDNNAYCDMWNTNILQGPHQDHQVVYEALYNRFDSVFSKKKM